MSESPNPPAFPNDGSPLDWIMPGMQGAIRSYKDGMSLRDFFAAHALTGILASPHLVADDRAAIAKACYEAADDMLAERAKAP